jgi:hypothetical protein
MRLENELLLSLLIILLVENDVKLIFVKLRRDKESHDYILAYLLTESFGLASG